MAGYWSITIGESAPTLGEGAWVAPGAVLAGAVTLAADTSVWYGAVVRADTETITIGARTNLQDGVVVHADPGYPVTVGTGVSVGHRAVLQDAPSATTSWSAWARSCSTRHGSGRAR